jgi:hypothetical protein
VRAVVGNTKSVPQIKVVELLPPSGVVPAGAVEPAPASPSQPANSPPGGEGSAAANSPSIDVAVRITNAPENMSDVKSRMVVVNEKATGSEIVQTYKAKPGYLITKVDLDKATVTTSPNLINLHAETVDNGTAVKVKAQVTTPGTDVKLSALLTYEEVRNPVLPKECTCTLSVPGSGSIDQPVGRKYEFEVRAKGVTIVKQADLPMVPVSFSLDGRYFLISTATAPGARLQIIVRETPRRLPS